MTLVEVLVVAAILGVVVMAVMSLFIPTVQNTAVQTEVSDVQSNLRLAIDRMTDDLLTAGFLIGNDLPIIFEGSATPTNADNPDNDDFTIQTALVSGGFGRISSIPTNRELVLEDGEMLEQFGDGAEIQLFNPIASTIVGSYTITEVDSDTNTLTVDSDVDSSASSLTDDLVVVRVKDKTIPIQKIRYRLENGALTRTINDVDRQFLARGIDAVNFDYDFAANRRVRRVEITLTGRTEERIANGAPTQKTRELRTSVTLRNIF